MGIVPWVVYVTPEGSIMRAVRYEGQWNQVVVFPGSEQARAGAPSLATDAVGTPDALAQVVFPVYDGDPPTENYVYYCSFKLDSVLEPVRLDSAGSTFCYGASIALTPGYGGHVAWARGESIYYRQRDTASVWSPPYRISQFDSLAITEPASHPSVEAYGDSVFCVWRGPNDLGGFPGDIWRRSRYLWNPVTWWENPSNQSQSPDSESDFPVMTTNFVTVWHEQVAPGNSDIWGRWLPDTASHPFFETSLLSRYPQVESWCGWSGPPQTPKTPLFRCWTVWTEQESFDVPECTLGFGWQDWNGLPTLGKGLGPCLHKDYELGLYYAAALGQPEQSPYCLSRGGFAQFESWNADTSATGLTYRLPYLDPRRTYRLRAVLYHEGDGTWKADWRCDSGPWSHVKVAPRVPDTIWVKVPKPAYTNDARIVVELARATGDYVSLAELKLFQIEEEAGEGGGVQSLDYGRVFVTHLRGCTPNPFSRRTSVNYELAQHGPVELTVHDVSGRLVRRLESGPRHRGFHAARWDGTDGRGRNVPAGVYFVRFSAGGKTSTGRMTLVR